MSSKLSVKSRSLKNVAHGNWLAGLTVGEGCFALSTRRLRKIRSATKKYRVLYLVFKISLRADDIDALYFAHGLLGVGRVGVCKRGKTKTTSPNAKPLAHLTVDNRSHIARVIEVFRAFPLRGKKQRDFELWAKAYEAILEALRTTPYSRSYTGGGRNRKPAGAPRTRFRTIPDDLWATLRSYERQIAKTREYDTARVRTR
jgi:hypothetical protein